MPRLSFPWRFVLSCLATLLVGSVAQAGTVTLSKTPPGVTSKVAPNIVVTFDDSGSMNSTSIPDAMDDSYGKKYYYSAKGNPIYFDPTVTYVIPPDALGQPLGTPTFTAAWRDGYCANTLNKKCWSPGVTSIPVGLYKDPVTVNLSSAFSTNFLTNTLAGNSPCPRDANEAGWYGNTVLLNSCAPLEIPTAVRGSKTSGSGIFQVTTYDTGAFYYVCTNGSDESTCTYHLVANESAATQANFAIWYSFYRTRNFNARAAIGRVFGAIGDNAVRVSWQTLQSQSAGSSYNTSSALYAGLAYGPLATASKILELANGASCTATSTADTCWRSQFMNWIYGVPASGGTPTRVATIAAGEFYKRSLSTTTPTAQDPYWNGSTSTPGELACRKNFHMLVTDGYWNGDKPGTVTPTDGAATTLPDGVAYSISDANSKIYWNQAGTVSPSLADIAFAYWATDLRSDLTNNVPAYWPDLSTGVTTAATTPPVTVDPAKPGATPEVYFNPANDPATWQHMSQYMVTMGISGTLAYNGDYTALRKGTKQWPTPDTGGGAVNIDDTWHAAVNSRGGYFSAADPTSLVSSLSSILSSVIASSSTALTVSLSTSVLTANAIAYYAGYDTTSWGGTLQARSVSLAGVVSTTALWAAEDLLKPRNPSNDARLIATSTGPGTGLGTAFVYDNLSTRQKAIMNSTDGTASTAATDTLGPQRVAWLSGTRTAEGSTFRTRSSLLGAIFGSQPAYVAAPSGNYSDNFPSNSPEAAAAAAKNPVTYAAFQATWASRPATVYVGANDGMLHAFDARLKADTTAKPGRELWAYVPASVYANLPAQSALKNFTFTPTVDGSPVTGDVFFNSDSTWHTLLVGSLRYGGRGVFGIDITDPRNATLSSATAVASKVLWEFNSDSVSTAGTPANLGYTFGTPVIARVAWTNSSTSVGRWVVLVPGGYFPDDSTATAAKNAYSSLFVLDAQTGTLLKEIRTPTGTGATTSHGLTTPTLGDYDGDQVADVAFAGDLDGNVWRIDLSSASLASTTQSQGVSLLFKPATANNQSITTAPRLVPDPNSAYFMVVFGTGRFLSTADTSDTTTQAIYGVRDPGTAVTTPMGVATLVQQTLSVDASSGAIGVSSNAVPASKSGWYLSLNNPSGERVVVTPALDASSSTVTFVTLIPTANDPCTTSTSGSLLALDATTGSAAYGVSIGTSTYSLGNGFTLAGARVTGAATSGALSTVASLSGGKAYNPSSPTAKGGNTTSSAIPTARRRGWRVLNSEN
ncbi:MAG: PilC/PilY family type IV pilus protein [Luteibacter sp.]